MTIAETILEQLGGRRFAVMTGTKEFVEIGNNALQMRLARNSSGANRLLITLDEAKDLYIMRFFRVTGGKISRKTLEWIPKKIKEIAAFEDIYCDQLEEIFREVTGLKTRMPRIIGINA